MKKELEENLCRLFPKLFRQKGLPRTESPMHYGVTVGDGWYPILYTLCYLITGVVEAKKLDGIEFEQIKEKFGSLRAYLTPAAYQHPEIQAYVAFAEVLSGHVCEDCGKLGSLDTLHMWKRTLCEDCKKNRYKVEGP